MKANSLKGLLIGFGLVALFCGCMTSSHPNLDAARGDIQVALDKLTAAQQANDYDMKGHAARAKDLLNQALEQVNLAEQAVSH